eukprot:GEMP01087750.1.p1 GENE.GEMP01087750.1~~GEMP01087750.1.p1  ORF type:complete len:105 (-),score=4.51 GEMP01087750.1:24-338(-)
MITKQISTSEEPSPLLPSRRAPYIILYPTNHEQRQSQYHHYHSHFNNAKLNSSSSSNEPPPTPLQRRFSVISVHHALAARSDSGRTTHVSPDACWRYSPAPEEP